MMIKDGKIQKSNKKSLKAKGKNKVNGKGKDKEVYIPKPKNPKPTAMERPAKDDTCHHYKEVGHCKRICPAYLAELIKKKKQVGQLAVFRCLHNRIIFFSLKSGCTDTSCGTLICNTIYGLGGVKKAFETKVEAIRRGVVSVHRLVENGFVQHFTDFGISVSKNNAIPSNVFKNEVENQLGKTIKAIRSDRGGEYISQEFKDYLKANGIVQQLTPPYTPQHNGVSERRNRTLLDMVRSMMNLTTLPLSFWDYALESATRNSQVSKSRNQWEAGLDLKKFKKKKIQHLLNSLAKIPQEVEEVEEHSLGDLNEPLAIKPQCYFESNKWIDAMNAEIQSMMDNMVWGPGRPSSCVGSIMYAVRCTRPDVAFAARYDKPDFNRIQVNFIGSAVKNILKLEEKLSNIESKNQVLCSPTGKSCHLLENPYLQDREQLLFRELQKMGMGTMEKKRWLHRLPKRVFGWKQALNVGENGSSDMLVMDT
ncbi:retrotransposon protein, putative, ty1-copia subclass [Tanacetum coccineum]